MCVRGRTWTYCHYCGGLVLKHFACTRSVYTLSQFRSRCIADHHREGQFPFLDEGVVTFLQQLPLHCKVCVCVCARVCDAHVYTRMFGRHCNSRRTLTFHEAWERKDYCERWLQCSVAMVPASCPREPSSLDLVWPSLQDRQTAENLVQTFVNDCYQTHRDECLIYSRAPNYLMS